MVQCGNAPCSAVLDEYVIHALPHSEQRKFNADEGCPICKFGELEMLYRADFYCMVEKSDDDHSDEEVKKIEEAVQSLDILKQVRAKLDEVGLTHVQLTGIV